MNGNSADATRSAVIDVPNDRNDALPALPALVTATIPRPRGATRRGVMKLIRTAATLAVLLIAAAGSASVVFGVRSRGSARTALDAALLASLFVIQENYESQYPIIRARLSAAARGAPELSRRMLEDGRAAAASLQSSARARLTAALQGAPEFSRRGRALAASTAESVELAWEKSEEAFHQLRSHVPPSDSEGGRKRNLLEVIFHKGEKNDRANNNLRKKEGRNDKQQQQRRAKAENDHRAGDGKREEGGEGEKQDHRPSGGLLVLLSKSPLAASLLAFCGILFLIASLVMPRGRSRRESIILNDEEAEIVEFYERAECGALETIPFLEDDLEEGGGLKRSASWRHNSERNLTEYRRSVSDSSLLRSDSALVRHRPEEEKKECEGDLYYSRVLDTLNYDEDGDGLEDENSDGIDTTSKEEEGLADIEEGHLSLLVEGDPDESGAKVGCGCAQSPAMDEDVEDAGSFQSAQSEIGEGSQNSSISSLTSEAYDDNAPLLSEAGHRDDERVVVTASSSISSLTSEGYDVEAQAGKRDLDFEKVKAPQPLHVSTAAVLHERRRIPSRPVEKERKLARRVSFSPKVDVCHIPAVAREEQPRETRESYLHPMLFAAVVAVVAFSLAPSARPVLSAMAQGDAFRADSMLRAHWDLEL